MKKKIYIAIVLLLPVLLLLSACEGKEGDVKTEETEMETRSLTVVLDTGADGEKEEINTVRFIVFKNGSSVNASVVFNQKEAVSEVDKNASKLTATLKVPNHKDLMVVAILNEPSELTSELDGVTGKYALENLQFRIGTVSTHTAVGATGMPMTGVAWAGEEHGYELSETEEELKNKPSLYIPVVRALAKVELLLKKEKEDMDVKVLASATADTKIHIVGTTSLNEYLYLVTGARENGTRYNTADIHKNFGHFPPVISMTYAINRIGPEIELTTTEQSICSYYTGERTYDKNSNGDYIGVLGFLIKAISYEGTLLDQKTLYLSSAIKEGESTATPVTGIERNNHYRIVGTVNERGIIVDFTTTITSWNDSYTVEEEL